MLLELEIAGLGLTAIGLMYSTMTKIDRAGERLTEVITIVRTCKHCPKLGD